MENSVKDRSLVETSGKMRWSAIAAGTVIALAVQLMLALLGAGIGFSTLDPGGGRGPSADGLGAGALTWWALSTIVALGAGAWGAARVARLSTPFDAAAHGLAIWALTLLATFYLLTSAIGGLVGGAFRTIGGIASVAASGAGAVAPTVAKAAGIDDADVERQVSALLENAPTDPATMTKEQARQAVIAQLPTMARGGDEGRGAESRIADIVAAQNQVSREIALSRVEKARQDFIQTKNEAIETAKDAGSAGASIASNTAFALFVVMLLGASASVGGGVVAVRRRR